MKAHVEDARKALVLVLGKHSRKGRRRAIAWAVSFLFLFYPVAPASLAGPAPAKEATHSTAAASSAQGGCTLRAPRGKVSHVIDIQFDNTHFTRDNPDVPSDLEQMPHLLNFLEQSGVILTNHHTPLISHTANDILTSLTGVYPDQHGVPVANSFRYFNPNGTSNLAVSFAYWTDPIFDPTTNAPTDTKYNMLTAGRHNAPPPRVPLTPAGRNGGAPPAPTPRLADRGP